MLTVIPVCSKDITLAIRNLEYALTLDGRTDFKCLISTEKGVEIGALIEAATRYFSALDVFVYDVYKGDPNWPRPQNHAWQETARYIENKYRLPWFWWEQDATPLKPGWLTTLAEAHKQGGRILSGAVTEQMGQYYVAGVAIYPWNISHHMVNALLTQAEPWDKMMCFRDGMLRKTHDLSALICHTRDRDNVTFTDHGDISRTIPDTAVIFHKCKDGSLLDILQGKTSESYTATPTDGSQRSREPGQIARPSFTEQTPWPSGYFTFPVTTSLTAYYNCSICEHKGSLWLFTRRHRFRLEDPQSGAPNHNQSDLAIWEARENMTLSPAPIIPVLPQRWPREQWEDPRVVIHEGFAYLAMCNWVHGKQWAIRQSFCKLTPDWRKMDVLCEPPYGGNARKPELATSHEKNWTWFHAADSWHCLYSINPHVVFKISPEGSPTQTFSNKPLPLPWVYGEPRGGTSPVRVGDEYIVFFHSALTWQKPKRRYFMGAYTFSAEPPFELLRITSEPLLSGSEEDFRALGGPLVIFPNGALKRGDDWLVVFGVNDEACGWIKIPHVALDERLVVSRKKRGIIGTLQEFVGV